MRAAAAACANGSGEQEVERAPAAARCRGDKMQGAPCLAVDKGVHGTQHKAFRQRLLQRSGQPPQQKTLSNKAGCAEHSARRDNRSAPASTHLNPFDANAQDTAQDARAPVQ
jgi:hypothetical protein